MVGVEAMSACHLWGCFVQTVDQYPDRQAIIRGDSSSTFSQLHDLAVRYSDWLASLGVCFGDRVLLWMQGSSDMAAIMLAIWRLGAIVTLMDPDAKASHLEHAVEVASPKLILRTPDRMLPCEIDVCEVRSIEELPQDPARSAAAAVLPTDPASIVFTSGSTGKPKGVTQSHRNLIGGCLAVGSYLGYGHDERIVSPVPWSFDYGYGQVLTTLITGATHIIPNALNPFAICEAIDRHQPTVFPGIPSIFSYLVQGMSPFPGLDKSSIRVVTNTGGTIPSPILRRLFELFPEDQSRFFLNYGLTETYRSAYLPPEFARAKPTSIGSGIPGVHIVVVREDGTQASHGEIGEIVHRGAYQCLGYWNNPEATARTLRPDPLAASGHPGQPTAVYTGDLGMFDDEGHLYYKGRRDQQIKSMGVRVNPGEIEELLWASGLVKEVAVFSMPNDLIGDEIWAAVVGKETNDGLQGRLVRYARTSMSPYMIPRRWLIKEALPKTRTGKTDYPALKIEAAADPSASVLGS